MKKSVLISGGTLGLGGAGTHLKLLCKVLCETEASVTIAATGSHWPLEQLEDLERLGVKFLFPPKLLCHYQKLSFPLSLFVLPFQTRQDFTSLYCISTGKSHLYLRKLLSNKTKGIYHEIVDTPPDESLGGRCVSKLNNVIANSRKIAVEISCQWPNASVSIIPFLTSAKRLSPPLFREAVGERELRVVYLGRMVPHKQPDKLAREWHHLCQHSSLSPARLDIYGYDQSGLMTANLTAEIALGRVSRNVYIHGSYDATELDSILENADLVVLPSLMEGLPLVLVEAMQRGIPVVATAAGGTEELGKENPDVIVTGLEWNSFIDGLFTMSTKIRSGQTDAARLHKWTETRYGYDVVSKMWEDVLLEPDSYFE